MNPTSGSYGSTSTCSSAGGHYDPDGVETDSYNCLAINFDTCYKGDLSGKHGTIGFLTGPAITDYTDPTLTLSDVMGRSIVIHQPELSTDFYVCASILEEGSALGGGGDNLPGGVNFQAAEAS